MARELLLESRRQSPSQDLSLVYAEAMNLVVGEIMARWSGGLSASAGSFVENVHLHDRQGNIVGFRFYLVVNEPRPLGKPRVEILDDPPKK